MVPLVLMPELDQEMKEKQTSIEGRAMSPPTINNETTAVGVFIDKLQDLPSGSDSSGSSSSSSTSGSDSDMDSDPMEPGEERPCEDVDSFKEKNEEDSQSLGFQDKNVTKKTIKYHIPRQVGRARNYVNVTVQCGQQHIQDIYSSVMAQCGRRRKQMKKQSLRKHIQEVHNTVVVQCGQCGKQMKKRSLRQHIQDIHISAMAQCGRCGKQVKKRYLSQHIQDNHSPKIKCTFCERVFSKRCLEMHIVRFHKDKATGSHKQVY